MTGSPYTDLSRPPLRETVLSRGLVVPDGLWTEVRVVAETGSTNADLAEEARSGGGEGVVLIAERQRAGRGRLNRSWQAPERAAITMSVLLRPSVTPSRLGWLPLLAGVALVSAIGRADVVAPSGPSSADWNGPTAVAPVLIAREDDCPVQSVAEAPVRARNARTPDPSRRPH